MLRACSTCAPDGLHDRTVRDLPALLRRGDLLVFNDTKVIPARLRGVRGGTAGRQDVAVEALLIRDLGGGPLAVLRPADQAAAAGRWPRLRRGFGATVEAKNEDGSIVLAFDTTGPSFLAALEHGGAVPLPPYIRGGVADAQDRADYQTMFARYDGSVAAPDRRPAFHARASGLAGRRRHRHGRASRCMSAPAPSSRCGSTTPMPTPCMPNGARCPQATARAIAETRAARRPDRLDRHDGAAPAGNRRARPRRRRDAPGPARPTSSSRRAFASAPSTCC